MVLFSYHPSLFWFCCSRPIPLDHQNQDHNSWSLQDKFCAYGMTIVTLVKTISVKYIWILVKVLIYEISVILINCSSALVGTWTRDLSLTKGVLYRWATRAILKWAGLDQSRLPAAQWFWSVQDKFRRPICCCQIISRECCNLSWVHFLQMILLLWDNFIDWQSI